MPTLYLMCGLPGSGKTTAAKRLEQKASALRLTGDEWLHQLYPGISTREAETGPGRSRVERLQWQVALRALELKLNDPVVEGYTDFVHGLMQYLDVLPAGAPAVAGSSI